MSILQKIYDCNINQGAILTIDEIDDLFHELVNPSQRDTTVDIYCVNCGKSKSFRLLENECYKISDFRTTYSRYVVPAIGIFPSSEQKPKIQYEHGIFMVCLYCPECKSIYRMGIRYDGYKFTKIFEYPDQSRIRYLKFKNFETIDKDFDYFIELATSSRLFVNGAFIGAFVYLRRCLEHFVKKHLTAKAVGKGATIDYTKLKDFSDYVEVVKDFIPYEIKDAIKDTYAIMNSGIHELSEDECEKYYALVFEITTVLLQTEVDEKEKDLKLRHLSKVSKTIRSEIAKKTKN